MKKVVVALVALLLIAIPCFAGGASEKAGSSTQQLKVGAIYTVAGLGGASFNDVIHEGCQRAAADFGIKYEYVEPSTVADEETVMEEMCISGEYALIICVGNEQKDALSTVAAKYPDQKFCYIDASINLPNIANYECVENEGSFLVGALCALAEQEGISPMFNGQKRFGFIGGVNNAIINRFAAGFIAGARYIDPSYTVDVNYVGGFADTTTAKAIATTMYNAGCDVVFHAAGGSGIGLFNAAKELGFIAVGVNTNQNTIAPDYIIASMLKRVDNAAYSAIESVVKGTFQGGTVTQNLAEGGVGYTNEGSNIKVTPTMQAKLDEIENAIKSGALKTPSTIEDALK